MMPLEDKNIKKLNTLVKSHTDMQNNADNVYTSHSLKAKK